MRKAFTAFALLTLLLLNTLVLIGPMLLIALLKLILPGKAVKAQCSRAVMWIAETWAEINKAIFALLLPTRWDIRGIEDLKKDRSYLVISNHQSWVDIPALVETLNNTLFPYTTLFRSRKSVV